MAININKNVKAYFDSHPKQATFYFVPDETGAAFGKQVQAEAQCAALVKAGNKQARVVTIERSDVTAWWPGQAKADVVTAYDALKAAEAAYTVAVTAQEALAPKATPVAKQKAANAVKNAENAENAANTALENAGKAYYECLFEAMQAQLTMANAGNNQADKAEAAAAMKALVSGGVALAISSAVPGAEVEAPEEPEAAKPLEPADGK